MREFTYGGLNIEIALDTDTGGHDSSSNKEKPATLNH